MHAAGDLAGRVQARDDGAIEIDDFRACSFISMPPMM
jgi:hypothetical protein